MPHCETCHSDYGEETEAEAVADAAHEEAHGMVEVSDREVEIARINAKRDVDLAKIGRGIAESEVVQEAEIATAEAEAVVETLAPEPAEQPVVVVDAPAESPEGDEPAGELPPAESDSEPSEAKPKPYVNPWFK
jgi:hypothetical protein